MAEAAIIREDLLKEQLATAHTLMARAQLDTERIKSEAAEQNRALTARVAELETLLKQVCVMILISMCTLVSLFGNIVNDIVVVV
jgi:hypothetical protein